MKGKVSIEEDLLYFGEGDEMCYEGERFNGIAFRLHPNGKLRSVKRYVNGFKDGICREWYANGRLKRRWCARHGQTTGIDREWYENGVLKCVLEVEFGVETTRKEYSPDRKLILDFVIDPSSSWFDYLLEMRRRRNLGE